MANFPFHVGDRVFLDPPRGFPRFDHGPGIVQEVRGKGPPEFQNFAPGPACYVLWEDGFANWHSTDELKLVSVRFDSPHAVRRRRAG